MRQSHAERSSSLATCLLATELVTFRCRAAPASDADEAVSVGEAARVARGP